MRWNGSFEWLLLSNTINIDWIKYEMTSNFGWDDKIIDLKEKKNFKQEPASSTTIYYWLCLYEITKIYWIIKQNT